MTLGSIRGFIAFGHTMVILQQEASVCEARYLRVFLVLKHNHLAAYTTVVRHKKAEKVMFWRLNDTMEEKSKKGLLEVKGHKIRISLKHQNILVAIVSHLDQLVSSDISTGTTWAPSEACAMQQSQVLA